MNKRTQLIDMFRMNLDRPLFFKYKKIMINNNIYSYFFNQYLTDELKYIKNELAHSLRGTNVNEFE
jgi:hypothetical protein